MKTILMFCFLTCFSTFCYADKTVWKGEVSSDGNPSEVVHLDLGKKYQIKVDGFVNLGKWVQNREELANDACFEFNKETNTTKIDTFKNSHGVSVCDGKYHPDHAYQSNPFTANQNRIHFWLHDTNYDDNTGDLKVEVIQLSNN